MPAALMAPINDFEKVSVPEPTRPENVALPSTTELPGVSSTVPALARPAATKAVTATMLLIANFIYLSPPNKREPFPFLILDRLRRSQLSF